jgi:CheY-like chemotaxis protein
VVEDEFIVADELGLYLRDLGCVVLGPTNSVAATLALLEGARPDAAILDVRLPDGFVTPVAERLAGAGVPFLLVTACMDLDRDVRPCGMRPAWTSPSAPRRCGVRSSACSGTGGPTPDRASRPAGRGRARGGPSLGPQVERRGWKA